MKSRIDGKFVEVTWQDGNDEITLLITPQDIVKNYHAAQQSVHWREFPTTPQVYKPEGVLIATERDGSQWVMLEDFITAQHSVQRTAYGTGWLARISNKIIGLGWWLAGIGSR